jgi:hypothetical protein
MGCIYCGYDTDKRKNGRLKVGMTERNKPTSRLTACGLNGLWYFEIPGATKAELLMIESAARLAGERAGLYQYGNDHFYYHMNYPRQPEKHLEAAQIAAPICSAVADACRMYELNFRLYQY